MRHLSVISIIVAGVLVAGCGGGGLFSGSGAGGSRESPRPSAPADDAPLDPEDEAADAPTQVSGAFLVQCEALETEPEAVGCAVLDKATKARTAKAVTALAVTVLVDGARETHRATMLAAHPVYHGRFAFERARWEKRNGLFAAATIDGETQRGIASWTDPDKAVAAPRHEWSDVAFEGGRPYVEYYFQDGLHPKGVDKPYIADADRSRLEAGDLVVTGRGAGIVFGQWRTYYRRLSPGVTKAARYVQGTHCDDGEVIVGFGAADSPIENWDVTLYRLVCAALEGGVTRGATVTKTFTWALGSGATCDYGQALVGAACDKGLNPVCSPGNVMTLHCAPLVFE